MKAPYPFGQAVSPNPLEVDGSCPESPLWAGELPISVRSHRQPRLLISSAYPLPREMASMAFHESVALTRSEACASTRLLPKLNATHTPHLPYDRRCRPKQAGRILVVALMDLTTLAEPHVVHVFDDVEPLKGIWARVGSNYLLLSYVVAASRR